MHGESQKCKRNANVMQTSQAVLEMLPRCEVNDGCSLLCDDDQGVIISR